MASSKKNRSGGKNNDDKTTETQKPMGDHRAYKHMMHKGNLRRRKGRVKKNI